MFGERLRWERDGHDWPNRKASRFVQAGRLRWHVQVLEAEPPRDEAPVLLLLHGTGASSHSFGDLAPLLARHFTCVIPDLPGHGFTDLPPLRGLSLPAMARGLQALLRQLDLSPTLVAGHSAGAAVLARMCLKDQIAPAALIALNGALLPYPGASSPWFAPTVKLAVWNPVVPRVFSARADERSVRRLIAGTGSTLKPRGIDLYGRLARNSVHVAGALGMMAGWDLLSLRRALPKLEVPLALLVGSEDRAIRPYQARQILEQVPGAELILFEGLGHLAHEEDPAGTAEAMLRVALKHGLPVEATVKLT
ncbi:alpha/beta fold hydrolase BchO [Algihabitans albus]|uniref:alpha/beta fold hydrolase BchO n=1 Tax=Algihabitans albus TaxID=2164067 RepID=UPI000E5C7BA1|nr:alpha/beta fold hydrolase BchO [Algihabitans albus]